MDADKLHGVSSIPVPPRQLVGEEYLQELGIAVVEPAALVGTGRLGRASYVLLKLVWIQAWGVISTLIKSVID